MRYAYCTGGNHQIFSGYMAYPDHFDLYLCAAIVNISLEFFNFKNKLYFF